MAETPRTEFGKRRREPRPAEGAPKRSAHVALLLMGTFAVGGAAYALMPGGSDCAPPSPGAASSPATAGACTSRSSGGHSGGSSSGRSYFSGDQSGRSSSTPSSPTSESGEVSRGGFGRLAHAFGFARGS